MINVIDSRLPNYVDPMTTTTEPGDKFESDGLEHIAVKVSSKEGCSLCAFNRNDLACHVAPCRSLPRIQIVFMTPLTAVTYKLKGSS